MDGVLGSFDQGLSLENRDVNTASCHTPMQNGGKK